MAHAIKIAEEVKQKLLRRGVPEPGAAEAERDGPERSLQDRQEIGRPALDPRQVSLLRIRRTLMTGHERARRRHVFINTSLTRTAVTQRHRECGDAAFSLFIQERMQAPEDCPTYQRSRKLVQPLFKYRVFGAFHFGTARGGCVVEGISLLMLAVGTAHRPGLRRLCSEKGCIVENSFQAVALHQERLTGTRRMKLFLRVKPGHHLADGRVVDAEDAMIQPCSPAVEVESAGAHQCRRWCSPDANDDLAIHSHLDEALLRGILAPVDKIAHVTPIEGVVSPTKDHGPRILGARPPEVLLR